MNLKKDCIRGSPQLLRMTTWKCHYAETRTLEKILENLIAGVGWRKFYLIRESRIQKSLGALSCYHPLT